MKSEYELIEHQKINDIKIFLIEINYRRPHLHTDLEIIYVVDGSLTVNLENQQLEVKKDQFIILNTCQLHEFISDSTAQLLILQFNTKSIEHVFPEINEILFDNQPINPNQSQTLMDNFISMCFLYFQEKDNFHLSCYGYAILALNELLNIVPYTQISNNERDRLLSRNERITRISQFINRHYHEKISLSELAENENLSTAYLSNFIKTHFGYTFQDLVNYARCEKAKYLLSNTKNNLLTISQTSGFSDVRYLNKTFKELFGMTPQQFRSIQSENELTPQSIESPTLDIQNVLTKDRSLETLKNHFSVEK
ncbi:AraC family transcriptional regulator [Mammaliicoccus sp. Dog046]|uniref:AraC family transcriptional regulator n=1 Tax=Mammaliicoccus sp. Dog046 TaxID=3034233 RepID=UPI002B25C0DD|nr:AraC family transcriptional regulator [Mammaliicoccus sp. Dog046]WQK84789.1 AraC family transcriptional regulator [Mammaliicoccus sp. Dog046]